MTKKGGAKLVTVGGGRQVVRRDARPLPNGPGGGLYSDQIASTRTRRGVGIKSRLGTRGAGIVKKVAAPSDGKWAHDLYEQAQAPRRTGRATGPVKAGDLRLRLNNRRQKGRGGGAGAGAGAGAKVMDLREKLLAKPKPPAAVAKAQQQPPPQRRLAMGAAPGQSQGAALANQRAAAENQGKHAGGGGPSKTEKSVHALLSSLGLQKYLLAFQREEVDMTALQHMTDNDLKELGVPMGPRKKIILAVKAVA